MTQNEFGGYGIQKPRRYVYWRGRMWLRQGFCPNCYSSPPNEACWVCEGNHNYGYHLTLGDAWTWRDRWDAVWSHEKYKRSLRTKLQRRRTHKRMRRL